MDTGRRRAARATLVVVLALACPVPGAATQSAPLPDPRPTAPFWWSTARHDPLTVPPAAPGVQHAGSPPGVGPAARIESPDIPAETWSVLEGPAARSGHVAVLDSRRHQAIVLGDAAGRMDVWAMPLDGQAEWYSIAAPGGPSTLYYAKAVYDADLDRVVVYSGHTGEVWALALGSQPAWSPLAAAGTPPPARYGHAVVHDSNRNRLIVFGGNVTGIGYPNDIWALSLSGPSPTWEQVVAGGTWDGVQQAAAIYDAIGDRLIVHGGALGNGPWRSNLTMAVGLGASGTWSVLSSTGPTMSGHAACYDPVDERMVLFGGGNYNPISGAFYMMNGAWVLSLDGSTAWGGVPNSAWTAPSPRVDAAMIWDAAGSRGVVLGGLTSEYVPMRDAWALHPYSSEGWVPLFENQALPPPDESHAVYDASRGRTVMLSSRLDRLWTLTTSQSTHWTAVPTSGTTPVPRVRYTLVHDAPRDRVLLFGGWAGQTGAFLSDLWALDLGGAPTWKRQYPGGGSPPGRMDASAAYDPVRQEMILFGGQGETGTRSDVWALRLSGTASNPGTPVWELRNPAGPSLPLRGHAAVVDIPGDRMLVVGGSGPGGYSSDVRVMSLGPAPEWSAAPLVGGIGNREYAAAVYDPLGHRVIVFGGANPCCQNDCWALGLAGTPSWNLLGTASGVIRPEGTFLPGLVLDSGRNAIILSGGGYGASRHATWLLPLVPGDRWHRIYSGETVPRPRNGAAWVVDSAHDRLILSGGQESLGNDVWSLPLVGAPVWRQHLPSGIAPGPRQFASGVFDASGDRTIIHGGSGAGTSGATWQLTLSGADVQWSPIVAAGAPPPLDRHSAIVDPATGRMIVHGGILSGSNTISGGTWALSLSQAPAWSTLAPPGATPAPRYAHGATYDALRHRLLVFGGAGPGGTVFDDIWALDLATGGGWSQLVSPQGGAPLSQYVSLVYDTSRDRVLGFPFDGYRPWELDLSGTGGWTGLDPAGVPVGDRLYGAMTRDEARGRFLVAGGVPNDVIALGPEPNVLRKPMGLSAVSGACTDLVRLRWIDASAEEGFEVQAKYSGADDATYTTIGTTSANIETFLTTGATAPGVPITFRVRATRVGEASPFSNEATATPGRVVLAGTVPPPKAVEVHSLGDGTRLRIRIHPPSDSHSSWAGIDELTLRVADNPSFSSFVVVPVALADHLPIETTFTGIEGTQYYVQARTGICGTSSVWVQPPEPVAPTLPPVLFCHGIFSDPGIWGSEWTSPLDAVGRPYRRIEFPDSDRPWPEWGDDLRRQLDALLGPNGDLRNHLQVDIVAHSQGGLASRHMIEEHGERRVRTLVMLGTPNHGARNVARYAGVLIRVCNILCDLGAPCADLEAFCEGAREADYYRDAVHALDANSEALRTLNFGHYSTIDNSCWDLPFEQDRRGTTDYRWIAGLGPSVFSCVRDLLQLRGNCFAWRARFGEEEPDGCEGDGIVSWKSVRIRGIPDQVTLAGHAHDRFLAVEGASIPLVESPQVRSQVFDWIDGTPNAPAMPSHPTRLAGGLRANANLPSDSVALHSVVDSIAGPSANIHPAVVDSAGMLVAHVTWPDSMGSLLLQEPGGAIHAPGDTASLPWLHFEEHSGMGYSAFLVDAPGPGTWTAHVTGPEGHPSVAYELSWVLVNSGFRLLATVEPALVRAGEPVIVRGTLSTGAGPVAAVIGARVLTPNGTRIDIQLTDDGTGVDSLAGDGTYSGVYATSCENAFHPILFSASPMSPGAPALRTVESGVHVVCHPELSVMSITPTPAVGQVGVPHQLDVRLRNLGETPATDVTVCAIATASGDTIGVAFASVSAGDTITVPISWTPALSGQYPIRVVARLVGQPEANLSDNQQTIAVLVGGAAPVAGLAGNLPVPVRFSLGPPRPNPFRDEVRIDFEVPMRSPVSLEVFDVLGRRIRSVESAVLPAGRYTRVWNGRRDSYATSPPGVYFVRLIAPGVQLHRKAVLIR